MSLILMPFQDLPFNGDIHIQKEFLQLQKRFNLNVAVETGSCLFSTTEWLGKTFSRVYTCENNSTYYNAGVGKVKDLPVHAILNDSVVAMDEIAASLKEDDKVIFFLDAHWNEHCPLNEELIKIAGMTHLKQPPVIAIHDWKVPDHPELGFDLYQGKEFTYDLIAASMAQVEAAFKEKYKSYYNSEATGAMRGIIYLTPSACEEKLFFDAMPAARKEDIQTAPVPMNMADPALNTLLRVAADVPHAEPAHVPHVESYNPITTTQAPDELMKSQAIGRLDRGQGKSVEIHHFVQPKPEEAKTVHTYKIESGTTIRLFGEQVRLETTAMFLSSVELWETVKNKELLNGFSVLTAQGFKKLGE